MVWNRLNLLILPSHVVAINRKQGLVFSLPERVRRKALTSVLRRGISLLEPGKFALDVTRPRFHLLRRTMTRT